MLFVFSGTGNSYSVARSIKEAVGGQMVDIAKSVRYKRYSFDANGEDVGFVFPVYYFGLPRMVKEFAENANIKNAGNVYAVITCGGESGGAGKMLDDVFGPRLNIDATYDVFMPDNAIFYENPPSKDEAAKMLADADVEVSEIISRIKSGAKGDMCRHAGDRDRTEEMYALYEEQRVTESFHINDRCIECRICEEVCPEQIIKIYHRKPVWDEEKCSMCMSCIMLCPKQAIEFGEISKGRNRYYNPAFYERTIGIPLRYD